MSAPMCYRFRAIITLATLSIVVSAVGRAGTPVLARCAVMDNQVVVNKPLPNWKLQKEMANSCILEKQDSVDNVQYVNTQVQVLAQDRKYISVPLDQWAQNEFAHMQSDKAVTNLKMADLLLSGKKAKQISYTKQWGGEDARPAVAVLHVDYCIAEPKYTVHITTYAPTPDAPKARPEIDQLVKAIELK